MNKAIIIIILLCAGITAAHAAIPFDFPKAKQAIELAATADAYSAYCKKPTTLGDDFLKRFTNEGIEKNKMDVLTALKTEYFEKTTAELTASIADCKNVEFMLKRLEIMRSLKDVSYELNGIDPATVKDNIPSVDALDPGAPPELPAGGLSGEDMPQMPSQSENPEEGVEEE